MLSYEDSTYTTTNFNSLEIAYFPVCSLSLDHGDCYVCGLTVSVNTKAAGILCHYFGKKRPRLHFVIYKFIFLYGIWLLIESRLCLKLLTLPDKLTEWDAFLTLLDFVILQQKTHIFRFIQKKVLFLFFLWQALDLHYHVGLHKISLSIIILPPLYWWRNVPKVIVIGWIVSL